MKWARNNSHKRKAQNSVSNAVRDGKLDKPTTCQECGTEVETSRHLHAHHEDYSKPLDVVWLCTACHGIRHTKHKALITPLTSQELRELRQLIDLETEEAIADIWTRFHLSPGEAQILARQAEIQNRGLSDSSGGPRLSPTRRPSTRKQ
jgi:hypothetical protein